MEEKKIVGKVSDMGSCAYLLMHGFKITGYCKHDRAFTFDIYENEKADFEEKQNDYLNSEFHRFDSFLMSIKKRYKTY